MSTNVSKSHNSMHYAHLKGAVNKDELIIPVANGVLKYPNPDHAVTSGHQRHVTHEIQPRRAPQTSFFSGTNSFVDIELPQDLHKIDRMDLHMELKNNGSSAALVFGGLISNLYSRVELRVGSEIKETITDVEAWLGQVPHRDDDVIDRKQNAEKISPSTYKVSFSIAASGTVNVRVPLRNVISQCGVPTSAINDQVTIRLYSQNAANVISSGTATDLQLSDLKMHIREARGLDSQIQRAVRSNLDWRYLQPKIEEKSIALTAGQTTRTVLNNFTEDDLCSHLWVLIRASNPIDAAQDDFKTDVASKIYLENEAGQNITNGIQWKTDTLLNMIYPDKFPNDATVLSSNALGLHLPLCPSQDPAADYNDGAQAGVQPLSRNIKLCIETDSGATSATYFVSTIAMCQRHVRTEGGNIVIQ